MSHYHIILFLLSISVGLQVYNSGIVTSIIKKQFHMGVDLSGLQSAVAAETTVDQSVLTLITQLVTEVQNANANNTDPASQAAIAAVVTQMTANAASLASAVTANTPAAPAPAQSIEQAAQ